MPVHRLLLISIRMQLVTSTTSQLMQMSVQTALMLLASLRMLVLDMGVLCQEVL